MKKLNFPIIKGHLPEPKQFSMDDYLKFVYWNIKYNYDKKNGRKWKKLLAVKVPFCIKQ